MRSADGSGDWHGPVHFSVLTRVEIKDEPPPPPPTPKPTPHAPISGGVLNGKAVHLVHAALSGDRAQRACFGSGGQVQVLIDENGNVVSAHAISGHPLLQAAAVSAPRGHRNSRRRNFPGSR